MWFLCPMSEVKDQCQDLHGNIVVTYESLICSILSCYFASKEMKMCHLNSNDLPWQTTFIFLLWAHHLQEEKSVWLFL